jgi:hypothetical protein
MLSFKSIWHSRLGVIHKHCQGIKLNSSIKDYLTRNSYWQYVGLIYSCKSQSHGSLQTEPSIPQLQLQQWPISLLLFNACHLPLQQLPALHTLVMFLLIPM